MNGHLAVDGLTPKAIVVLQDRPVVPFTKWLADGLRFCSETRRGLQIVTPPTSRITMPLRLVLNGPSRWVVRDDGGFYDGLSGTALSWDGAAFVQATQTRSHVPAFTTAPRGAIGSQLTITVRVRHASEAMIGGAVELMCLSLTGEPPGGWGTAEPATGRWRRDDVAELFRARRFQATWLTVVGGVPGPGPAATGQIGGNAGSAERPAVAAMVLSAAKSAIEEAVTLVVGYDRSQEPPVGSLPTLVGALAIEHSIVSLFAQLSRGRADLTTEPRWAGASAPIGMAVGGEIGRGAAGLPGIPGQQIGDARSPAIWYALGDGRSQDGWRRYEELSRHLRSQRT